jgi:hypothetical protein
MIESIIGHTIDCNNKPLIDCNNKPMIDCNNKPMIDCNNKPMIDCNNKPMIDCNNKPMIDCNNKPMIDDVIESNVQKADFVEQPNCIAAKTNFYLYVNQLWINDPENKITEGNVSLNLYTELTEQILQKQISYMKRLSENKTGLSGQEINMVAIWDASNRLTANWDNMAIRCSNDISVSRNSQLVPLSRELEILDAYLMPNKPIAHKEDLILRIAEYYHYSWLNQIPNIFDFDAKIDDSTNILNIRFNRIHENDIDEIDLESVSQIINENCTTQLDEDFVPNVMWFKTIISDPISNRLMRFTKTTKSLESNDSKSNSSESNDLDLIDPSIHGFFDKIYELFDFDQILKENLIKKFGNDHDHDQSSDNRYMILCDNMIPTYISLILCEEIFGKYRSYLQYKIIETFYRFTSYDLYRLFNPSQINNNRLKEKYSCAIINEWIGQTHESMYDVDSKNKETIGQMIEKIVETLKHSIRDSEQISDQIKQKILDKIKEIRIIIGSPGHLDDNHDHDHDELKINIGDEIYDIFKKVTKYQNNKFFKKISSNSIETETQSSLLINGYYSSMTNRLTVPLGMIQYPLYCTVDKCDDIKSSDKKNLHLIDAVNFGKLYTIISSAIIRGLDDYVDGELFKSNIDIIKNQSSIDNLTDSNLRVLISDFLGLSISLKTFKNCNDSDGTFNSVRIILEAYASLWRQITSEINLQKQINTGSISGNIRAQIVNNLDEFYDVYDVSKSDPMYIEPIKRLRLF